ncbi:MULTISPECIES: heme-binding protein [unclassified Mycobacterium]|uniref:SOUL family heme-binding protein n=1 Tax=unclassified Mycobacterium TaxID=2642494 RepID=UPI000F928F1E|nr:MULTISPECIES: heme-binding protein [unclassified Mycobacterium]MDP7703053.1 heme-binding protein [Mycobacterium sp. TY815]MDP7721541.1 heme-binding protein [Mycobacterium sp. TY814]RUP03495.1 MAG: heme-binding protein [Mycobacterium sp.]
MLKSIGAVVGQFAEAAGMVVGYRHGIEEPAHTTEKLTRDVEIRHYGDRIAAQTTVVADEESARNVGFRRLARYIFGANNNRDKIAMTAPVAQESRTKGEWVIQFFMPSHKTMDTLPAPDEGDVKLVNVPPATVAVHKFSGIPTKRSVESHTKQLMNTLGELGFEATDSPAAWFYDPPWTVPALRRNEIAVPVKPRSEV